MPDNPWSKPKAVSYLHSVADVASRAGYPGDVARLGRRELQDFFTTHYTPQRLTIAIVGDVNPTQVGLAFEYCQWVKAIHQTSAGMGLLSALVLLCE